MAASAGADGRALCNALRSVLAARHHWDEEPVLYCILARDDGLVTLVPALAPGMWPGGEPGPVLAELADMFTRYIPPGVATRLAQPEVCGLAFRVEIYGADAEPGTAEVSELRSVAYARKLRQSPISREMRSIWAVTTDRRHYFARQARGEREVLAHKIARPEGCVPSALVKMLDVRETLAT